MSLAYMQVLPCLWTWCMMRVVVSSIESSRSIVMCMRMCPAEVVSCQRAGGREGDVAAVAGPTFVDAARLEQGSRREPERREEWPQRVGVALEARRLVPVLADVEERVAACGSGSSRQPRSRHVVSC